MPLIINIAVVYTTTGDRARWRQKVKRRVEHADSERGLNAADKRACRKLSAPSRTNAPTGFISILLCLQKGLPFADWPLQPHKTLQLYKNRGLNLF